MKKIFKTGEDFIVTGPYMDEPDGGRRYTEKGLVSYLINEAPNIEIDTKALRPQDHRTVWQAYLKGLGIFNKKKIGV